MPQLNTPTFMKSQRPNRPSSLNVPANMKPSDFLARKNVADIAGISVNTPSSGMFNFDSLMEGGTGLTPVNPLVPCSTQNRNPMDMLQTPTSEPSKLVSLWNSDEYGDDGDEIWWNQTSQKHFLFLF